MLIVISMIMRSVVSIFYHTHRFGLPQGMKRRLRPIRRTQRIQCSLHRLFISKQRKTCFFCCLRRLHCLDHCLRLRSRKRYSIRILIEHLRFCFMPNIGGRRKRLRNVNPLSFVVDTPEHQSARRRIFSCRRPITCLKHLFNPRRLMKPITNRNQRPYKSAHHRMQKCVTGHRNNQHVIIPNRTLVKKDFNNIAMGWLIFCRFSFAETLEIMLPNQILSSFAHSLNIKLLAQMPTKTIHEKRIS